MQHKRGLTSWCLVDDERSQVSFNDVSQVRCRFAARMMSSLETSDLRGHARLERPRHVSSPSAKRGSCSLAGRVSLSRAKPTRSGRWIGSTGSAPRVIQHCSAGWNSSLKGRLGRWTPNPRLLTTDHLEIAMVRILSGHTRHASPDRTFRRLRGIVCVSVWCSIFIEQVRSEEPIRISEPLHFRPGGQLIQLSSLSSAHSAQLIQLKPSFS